MSSEEQSFLSVISVRNKWEQMASDNNSTLSSGQINTTPALKPFHPTVKSSQSPNYQALESKSISSNDSEVTKDESLSKIVNIPPSTHHEPEFDKGTNSVAETSEPVAHRSTPQKPRPSVRKKPAHLTGVPLKQTPVLEISAKPAIHEANNCYNNNPSSSADEGSHGTSILNEATVTIPTVVVASSTPVESTFLPPPFRKLSPVVPIVNNGAPVPPPSRPVTPNISSTTNASSTTFVPPPDPAHLATLPVLPPRSSTTGSLPITQTNASSSKFAPPSLPSLKPDMPNPSSFAPPPPLPRLIHPQPQAAVILNHNEEAINLPKPKSPVPPVPPPSRKLNHSSSQTSLNANQRQSPLPSPSEPGQPTFLHHPQPIPLYQKPLPHSSSSSQVSSQISLPASSSSQDLLQPTLPQQIYQPPPPPQRMDYFSSSSTIARSSTLDLTSNSINVSKRNQKSSSNQEFSSGGEDTGYESDDGNSVSGNSSYPDSSQANRRAPIFSGPQHEIPTRHRVETTAIYGNILIVSSHNTKVVNVQTSEILWSFTHSDTRFTAIGFKPMRDPNLQGTVAWLGTKEGQLWEIDLNQQAITSKRLHMHMVAVVAIEVVDYQLWTISEDGKICIWEDSINATPKAYRMTANFKAHCISGDQIWVGRNRQVHVYHPTVDGSGTFNITPRPIACLPMPVGKIGGDFTSAATVIRYPDNIYFGHEDGSITMFSRSKGTVIESVNISIHKITAMTGVGSHLWVCLKNGLIYVIDISKKPWKITKEWKGHEMGVRCITSNERSFFSSCQVGHMPVVSIGQEPGVFLWDGLLKTDWIENDMQLHTEDFCSYREVDVLNITWNAGAARPTDLDRSEADRIFLTKAFSDHCTKSPEIIVFGFQELVELDNKAVTAKTMFQSNKRKKEKEAKIVTSTHISGQYKAWQDRLASEIVHGFGEKYKLVHSNNMVGLFTCVFVKADELGSFRSVKSNSIKTGLGGLHGNKGGLAVRLMVDDSSICFVNCHLAAGQTHSLQRNKDIETILETRFLDASENTKYIGKGIFANGGDGTMILDHEFCFFSGDMNYRLNMHRQIAIQAIQDEDFPKLIDADQLTNQLIKNPGHRLRAFQEANIAFPPTYKFDVGTDQYDSSEKRRVPAWCDRIFFRGGVDRIQPLKYTSLTVRVSDHRPVMGVYRIQVKTINSRQRTAVYKQTLERWDSYLKDYVTSLGGI